MLFASLWNITHYYMFFKKKKQKTNMYPWISHDTLYADRILISDSSFFVNLKIQLSLFFISFLKLNNVFPFLKKNYRVSFCSYFYLFISFSFSLIAINLFCIFLFSKVPRSFNFMWLLLLLNFFVLVLLTPVFLVFCSFSFTFFSCCYCRSASLCFV